MTKQEFLDKIDEIRTSTNHLFVMSDECYDEWHTEADRVIKMLEELRTDAEQLCEDEHEAGYELGLNRGWNHEDMDCE